MNLSTELETVELSTSSFLRLYSSAFQSSQAFHFSQVVWHSADRSGQPLPQGGFVCHSSLFPLCVVPSLFFGQTRIQLQGGTASPYGLTTGQCFIFPTANGHLLHLRLLAHNALISRNACLISSMVMGSFLLRPSPRRNVSNTYQHSHHRTCHS